MTEMPDNILHLQDYQVIGCKSDDEEMHFQVEAPDPIACESCGVQGEFVKFGKRDVAYKDLPIHGKRVTLWVIRRRYTCRACDSTFRPNLPNIAEHFRMTNRLHEYIEKESFNYPYTVLADRVGVDEKTVRGIFSVKAEQLDKLNMFETPEILGIDELYLNKKYRCILTNIGERTLLDLLPVRNKDVVINYLMRLKTRSNVRVVSMDMWNPYREAVKAVLPRARIVVDKFHVVRMANEALEVVRKSIKGKLTQAQRKTLKGDRKILLKRAHELSDREAFLIETWMNAFPELKAAYEHKERFFNIWNCKYRMSAELTLDDWIAETPVGQKEVWSDLIRAATNWREEIMTYFDLPFPVTNAFTESINRLAKDKNREGRGYSFEVMRARMLYTSNFKKKPQPKVKESPFIGDFKDMRDIPSDAESFMFFGVPEFEEEPEDLNYGVDLSTI